MEVGDTVFTIIIYRYDKVCKPVDGVIMYFEEGTSNYELFRYEVALLKLTPFILNNTINRKLIIDTLEDIDNSMYSPYTIRKVSQFTGMAISKTFVKLDCIGELFPKDLTFQDTNIRNKYYNCLNNIFEVERCRSIIKYIKEHFK